MHFRKLSDHSLSVGDRRFNLDSQDKLKMYVAPVLHCTGYTSFGCHYAKVEKLEDVYSFLSHFHLLYPFAFYCSIYRFLSHFHFLKLGNRVFVFQKTTTA